MCQASRNGCGSLVSGIALVSVEISLGSGIISCTVVCNHRIVLDGNAVPLRGGAESVTAHIINPVAIRNADLRVVAM